MATEDGTSRRVSMAYILGFSNKPFKESKSPVPTRQSHANCIDQVMHTPGGLVEWAASDGRKGKLTGPGTARRTSALLKENNSQKGERCVMKKEEKKEDVDDTADGGFGLDLFDEGKTSNDATKSDDSKKPDENNNPNDWSEGEDKKLLDWKTDTNGSWRDCAEALGRSEDQCKQRFGRIKPKGWKPKNSGSKKHSKNDDKHEQKRSDEGDTEQNKRNDKDKKEEEKIKEGNADGNEETSPCSWDAPNIAEGTGTTPGWDQPIGSGGGGDDGWPTTSNETWGQGNNNADTTSDAAAWDKTVEGENNGVDWGNNNDNSNDSDKKENDGWGNASNPKSESGNQEGGWVFNDSGKDGWGKTSSADGGGAWDQTDKKDETKSSKENNHTWSRGSAKKGSAVSERRSSKEVAKSSSNRAPSRRSSHSDSGHRCDRIGDDKKNTPRVNIELKPDDIFSADDLRLVARIMQQDHQMLWNRVSWRFKDKTGRMLAPDVFKRKIVGQMEDKED